MAKEMRLGVVGVGHWFDRLNEGIKKTSSISIQKAIGTRRFEEKSELLSRFGITKNKYYTTDISGRIPDSFFDDLDIVHIADPNKFHSEQTLASLNKAKLTIVEKTFGINREEFNNVLSFIKKNNYNSMAYLHLHYIHKQPTIKLIEMLPELIKQNGKITHVQATFFEKDNQEDLRRKWIFSPENGGIFMDWIHPFEIISYAADARFGKIEQLKTYTTNKSYDVNNPTGVEMQIRINGDLFNNDSIMLTKMAKGVKDGSQNKYLKLKFESGNYVKLIFEESKTEFESSNRGFIEFGNKSNIEKKNLSGPTSSDIFVDEILAMANGKPQKPDLNKIAQIFEPQWKYQEMIIDMDLIDDQAATTDFLTAR